MGYLILTYLITLFSHHGKFLELIYSQFIFFPPKQSIHFLTYVWIQMEKSRHN